MSEASDLKATLKAAAGYDAPWLTIDGVNPDDLKAKLERVAEIGLLGVLTDTATLLHGAWSLSTTGALPQQSATPAPQHVPQQPPAQPAPAAGVKTCAHGVRTFKSGTSAKGPWQAWMCAMPKGTPGACDPEWVR